LLSRIIRLRLTFDGAVDAPAFLILKTGLRHRADLPDLGRREVEFYTQAVTESMRIVPRCFEAVWDADKNTWHLLLEDLTSSHMIATAWPLPPTQEQCESIVRALARLHGEWWNDGRFGVSIGTWPDTAAMNENLKRLADRYKTFADRLGDRLSPERRDLYERFLDAAPRLLARYHSRRNLSIVHGDAHVWNFFLPRDGGEDVRFLTGMPGASAWRQTTSRT
jgi:hypothetical protein